MTGGRQEGTSYFGRRKGISAQQPTTVRYPSLFTNGFASILSVEDSSSEIALRTSSNQNMVTFQNLTSTQQNLTTYSDVPFIGRRRLRTNPKDAQILHDEVPVEPVLGQLVPSIDESAQEIRRMKENINLSAVNCQIVPLDREGDVRDYASMIEGPQSPKPGGGRVISSARGGAVSKTNDDSQDSERLTSKTHRLKVLEGLDKDPQPLQKFMNPDDVKKDQSVGNCLICYESYPDAVILECGHGGLCYQCAVEMWKKADECFLCRKVTHPRHTL